MTRPLVRVLFLVNSLDFGGAERQVVSLVNCLDTSRFRLSLASLKRGDALCGEIDHSQLEGRLVCCGASRKLDWRAVRHLAALIRKDAIDIVVCTNTYPLLYGWLARLKSGCRPSLIEVFHTTSVGTIKGTLLMLLYRPLFLACDMLVYVCETQRSYWRARFLRARRDTMIHNGVDIERFADRFAADEKEQLRHRYGLSAGDYVVGLCAVMRPEKAHDDMLRALAMAIAAGVDVKCLFIGDGPERGWIERRIDELGLDRYVRLTGFLRDVRPLIAVCDAMALVSHHVETFSIAALEAMALGKPMIMSRIGGAAEQVTHGENGYLFERGDIASLADALCRLADATLRERMGERARAMTAERFSMAAMVHGYERLFSAMARQLPSRSNVINEVVNEAGHGR